MEEQVERGRGGRLLQSSKSGWSCWVTYNLCVGWSVSFGWLGRVGIGLEVWQREARQRERLMRDVSPTTCVNRLWPVLNREGLVWVWRAVKTRAR